MARLQVEEGLELSLCAKASPVSQEVPWPQVPLCRATCHFSAPLCVWGGRWGRPPFLCGTGGGTRRGAFLTDTLCWVAQPWLGNPDGSLLLRLQNLCCGAYGPEDWDLNVYFNCSGASYSREKCGVPFSCCVPDPAVSGPRLARGARVPAGAVPTVRASGCFFC